MELQPIMESYFAGERSEALFFIVPFGVLSLLFAAVVLRTQQGGFMWGVAGPAIVFGLMLLAVGLTVGLRTPGQVRQLRALHEESPQRLVEQERPRMEQVNRNWPIYLGAYVAFIAVGLGLRFLVRADWALGLGIMLVFYGGAGMVIDGFAERRARPYGEALEQLSASSEGP